MRFCFSQTYFLDEHNASIFLIVSSATFCFLINIWYIIDLYVDPVSLRFVIKTRKFFIRLAVLFLKIFSFSFLLNKCFIMFLFFHNKCLLNNGENYSWC